MRVRVWVLPVCALFALCSMAVETRADSTLTVEPDGRAYQFVSHYQVRINATPGEVWPHLLDLPAWMYEFDLTSLSGTPGQAGEVLRLYSGQDFKIQITKVVPQQALVVANLPSTFKNEYATGVGIFTLHDHGAGTLVELLMSRRYSWQGVGDNPQQAIRASAEFQANTDAMWQKFLARLALNVQVR